MLIAFPPKQYHAQCTKWGIGAVLSYFSGHGAILNVWENFFIIKGHIQHRSLIHSFFNLLGGIHGSTLDCWSTGRSINPCTRVLIYNKIHLIRQGCSRPSITLQEQNHGLKHQSFHFFHLFILILQKTDKNLQCCAGNTMRLHQCHNGKKAATNRFLLAINEKQVGVQPCQMLAAGIWRP